MEKVKLTDICDFQGGSQPPKEEWSFEEQDGYIRMLQIRDFTQSERVVPEYIKVSNSTKTCEADDILIARYGASIGKILTGLAGAYNVAIMRTIPDTSKVQKRYLYYYLKSPYFQNAILNVGVRAAQAGFNKEDLSKLEIECPALIEQDEIVRVLEKVELVIEKRKQELTALNDLIKSRFIEIFGDPVHNPKGWTVKPLGELSVQINSGNTPKGGEQVYVEKGIMFFRSQNVWKDRIEMDDIAYIDEETHASMSRSSLKHGDILMTKTGRINTENSSLGRAALYMGEDDAANVNGHVYFIRLKPGVNNKFILRILVSDEYRDYIRSVCVGGIDKRQLNKNHIEDFPIICPPDDMVDEYISLVEQTDKLKLAVQKSLDETQELFDSLMQKYFG
ncbi:restriction endonuclease subunit S [Roseburia sp. 499]|uniref:restriction endonuclease subunit S n=1 Tax=Roseburia sp. 499 TaxID=1261634 RepID=UPI0009FA1A79|nr:restriction endonuclease subunit S [Roseburia sp. 499]WVK68815.1 restriction endonuclease subunit S [Roseburia sp. 499]